MTFLNFVLLGGVAAASIPLIIHLLHRSRFRVVKWGATHLMDAALIKNSKRIRIEQLLLLILRCLIPAVLAFCMARPVLSQLAALAGASKTSIVLMLDNSYSMESGGKDNGNFVQARNTASQIITSLGRGSDVEVILMAGENPELEAIPNFDLSRLGKAVSELDAGYGKADVAGSFEKAAALLGKMQNTYRQIVVVSDFQRISWADEDAPARDRSAELLRAMPLPPQVTFVQQGVEGRDNVSVESLDFSRLIVGVRQPIQVRANLRNFGDRTYSELRVYFRVDGTEKGASQISLGPGERQQVLFSHAFETAGSHVIEVVADADTLKADNSYQAAIPVWDTVPVLLFNGAPSVEPLKGETDFLEIALQPFGKSKSDLTDLITTKVIDEERDLKVEDLPKYRTIVLANVRQLSDRWVRALKEFVNNGGGLLIFPGDRIDTTWYNRVLANDNGILPLPLASISTSSTGQKSTKIISQNYAHPAMEMFNDPRNGNLSDGEITSWFKLAERKEEQSINVLARLETGEPFLVEKKLGEGRIIQCAIPCDADWSNLPVRSFYLPLTQRLVVYLASTIFPPRNFEVGKPAAVFLDKADIGKKAMMLDPAGQKYDVTVADKGTRGLAEFTATQRPGQYLLTAPDGKVTHFIASTSRDESDLLLLSEAEREAAAKPFEAKVISSFKEFQELDRSRRFGSELWRPLMWLVLAMLFSELFLQQWITRRRR